MAITLITGNPGAGKTLYCIDKILLDFSKNPKDAHTSTGEKIKIQRKLFTNIPHLLIEHELIDAEWLSRWHENVQPGDLIVFDEVQRVWPQATAGSTVPPEIKALETHRHLGVDIVLLTQHPMLLRLNVRALIGRHLHIRRMSGGAITIVYEWDSCSTQLQFSKSITRSPFVYSKKIFELYKSADLHTKQANAKPLLLFVALFAIIALVPLFYYTKDRVFNKKPDAPPPPAVTSPSSAKSPSTPVLTPDASVRQLPTDNNTLVINGATVSYQGTALSGPNQLAYFAVYRPDKPPSVFDSRSFAALTGLNVLIRPDLCAAELRLGNQLKHVLVCGFREDSVIHASALPQPVATGGQ